MNRSTILWTSLACCLAFSAAAYGDPETVDAAKSSTALQIQGLPPKGEVLTFENQKSELCMGVDRASKKNGALVKQFPCDGRPNQQWRVVGRFTLQNVNSGKCLGVDRASVKPGANIGQYDCEPNRDDIGSNQSWDLLGIEGSTVKRIINKKSTLHHGNRRFCVGVNRGSKAKGAQLKQFPCDAISLDRPSNQAWLCKGCRSPR